MIQQRQILSSSLSALSFAVDESERKEKCFLNLAFKSVNYLAIY